MSDSPPGDPAAWGGWFSATTEPADDGSERADDVTSEPAAVPAGDCPPAVDVDTAPVPPGGSSFAPEGSAPRSGGSLHRLIDWPGRWVRSWTWPGRGDRSDAGSGHTGDVLLVAAAARRRWPRPDPVTYVLVSLVFVLAGLVTVLYATRPDAKASSQSACTRGIASTGAVVHAATLRSIQGSGGRWTVGVQATDGSGTRQWVCHVVWDGARATILTALPGTQ